MTSWRLTTFTEDGLQVLGSCVFQNTTYTIQACFPSLFSVTTNIWNLKNIWVCCDFLACHHDWDSIKSQKKAASLLFQVQISSLHMPVILPILGSVDEKQVPEKHSKMLLETFRGDSHFSVPCKTLYYSSLEWLGDKNIHFLTVRSTSRARRYVLSKTGMKGFMYKGIKKADADIYICWWVNDIFSRQSTRTTGAQRVKSCLSSLRGPSAGPQPPVRVPTMHSRFHCHKPSA